MDLTSTNRTGRFSLAPQPDRMVYEAMPGVKSTTLLLSRPGIYFVTVWSGEKNMVRKVVVP